MVTEVAMGNTGHSCRSSSQPASRPLSLRYATPATCNWRDHMRVKFTFKLSFVVRRDMHFICLPEAAILTLIVLGMGAS